jgi:hypothetical protein
MRKAHEEELIKELEAYFNLDINEFSRKRLMKHVNKYVKEEVKLLPEKPAKVRVVKVYTTKRFDPIDKIPHINALIQLANDICGQYHITMRQLKAKRRKRELVEARRRLCVEASEKLNISEAHLGVFLGMDRTSVINMIRYMKPFEDKWIRTA